MTSATSVDDYIRDADRWRAELRKLREILIATKLKEEIKWGGPCYTHHGKNVVGLGAFKTYFGLWFHQGALLKDDDRVLVNAQEGKTRALRQWRMTSADDIKPAMIRHYLKEAIAHADVGHEVKAERSQPVDVPPELQKALRSHKGLLAAFQALRKGLQREYADYIASAKRDETKQQRIEKILPMISAGVGLNDKYRR
jgi:uncharacterized protein YdeI (YjbR/CyaY-like superfamily)